MKDFAPKQRSARLTFAAMGVLAALGCFFLDFVGFGGFGASGAAQNAGLHASLAQTIREAGLGDRVGAHVIDIASGETLFGQHPNVPLNPASNMKLLTAATALLRLGPNFQMQTGLYGRISEGHVPQLVLRSFGDPSLRMSDLVELAERLKNRSVRSVGTVIVDGAYFDQSFLPPSFEQQPNEASYFRAPVAAVSVERNAYSFRVLPGNAVGASTTIRMAAQGYFDINNTITTHDTHDNGGGPPRLFASQHTKEDGRMALRLRGSVSLGTLGASGPLRRVENPLFYSGYAMADALQRAGIRGRRRVQVGNPPNGLALLASRSSAPVSQLLYRVGKNSDNFYAEMLLKVIGAEKAKPGTSARGVEVVQSVIKDAGGDPSTATIVNGSGLFDGNLIAPAHITRVLQHMYKDPAVRPEYLAHLSVGGADGTLKRRLRNLPAPRIVRAKTGTLNDVIALSGYVLGPEGQRTVAFSVLINGARGKHGAARSLGNHIVEHIARYLYR